MEIEARIYWDDQDSNNLGWAWAVSVNGDHDSSGPLDNCSDDSTDAQLIAALRLQVLTSDANASLQDNSVRIAR